jgi:type IV fimbrial biogenesis protein FimT
MSTRRVTQGLTLVELLTVIAIVVVLLALAVPSFVSFIARQRVNSITNELVHDMQYARSEAMQRKQKVYLIFGTALSGQACYLIYISSDPNPSCNVCGGAGPCQLTYPLKEVVVPSSIGFATSPSVAAKTPSGRIDFLPERQLTATGLAMVDPPLWNVQVASSVSGRLLMAVDAAGRSKVCSPDGSISGAKACD